MPSWSKEFDTRDEAIEAEVFWADHLGKRGSTRVRSFRGMTRLHVTLPLFDSVLAQALESDFFEEEE